MPKLQTKVDVTRPDFSISYTDKITLLGSCFSDNVGALLKTNKFNTLINPFGVLYNPASISNSLKLLLEKKEFTESDLQQNNDLWFSYKHHTSFSDVKKEKCLSTINSTFLNAKDFLNQTDVVVITLGTAWIYRIATTNEIVANCHKIPSREFKREYLEPEQIVDFLSPVLKQIINTSPKIKFIFTISPIRHWKDGAIENMRSKASLLLSIKKLQELIPNLYYFPSFEIFMDELRDYRFYASDMLHPSDFSIEYIWEIFKHTFFSKETLEIYKDVCKVKRSFSHKPFNPSSGDHKKFKEKLFAAARAIEKRNPGISFSEEISSFV